MKRIAIITARGGSKRIPKKNIKLFLGQPIICYSIRAAKDSKLFDEVMVSTDDPEIEQLAILNGANVPFRRSAKNSDDFSTTANVLTEVLNNYRNVGIDFDYTCCIYPTAPFVNSEKLRNAYDILISTDADSVFPITQHSQPLYRSLNLKSDRVQMAFPEYENIRSQDLPVTYYDSGQFYWLNNERFLRSGKIYTDNSFPMVLPEFEVQDIDNESDWQMAEIKYKFLTTQRDI